MVRYLAARSSGIETYPRQDSFLRNSNNLTQALYLANRWKDSSPEIAAMYINLNSPIVGAPQSGRLEDDFLASFQRLSIEYKIAEGAEALGWYQVNTGQSKIVGKWFDRALAWNKTETAAFGKTLNTSKRKFRKRFFRLKKRYAKRYRSVAKLQYASISKVPKKPKISRYDQLASAMVIANRRGQFGKCDQLGGQLVKAGLARGKDHELRGWCRLNRKRFKSVSVSFSRAIKRGGIKRSNARYGLGLTALNSGQLNEASKIAKTL